MGGTWWPGWPAGPCSGLTRARLVSCRWRLPRSSFPHARRSHPTAAGWPSLRAAATCTGTATGSGSGKRPTSSRIGALSGKPAPRPIRRNKGKCCEVGGWRGALRSFSIRPFPNAPCVISTQYALQSLTAYRSGWWRCSSALGISPTSRPRYRRLLCPFALWPVLPASLVGRDPHGSYGHSVTMALAGCRPSRVPSPSYVRASRRRSIHSLA
jgi:hypothetical protein